MLVYYPIEGTQYQVLDKNSRIRQKHLMNKQDPKYQQKSIPFIVKQLFRLRGFEIGDHVPAKLWISSKFAQEKCSI